MNSLNIKITLIVFSLISIQTFLKAQEAQHYVTEPNHSTIEFSMPLVGGITRISGKFTKFLIDLSYVDADLTKSTFKAKIRANSINTGIERRDNHLRSATFFDVEKYPEIIFESNVILKTDIGYLMKGKLTMHGITKAIEIPFEFKGATDRYLAFEAKSSLLRSDFDIALSYEHPGFPNFLSDRVDFTFSFWTIGPVPDDMIEKVRQQLYGN